MEAPECSSCFGKGHICLSPGQVDTNFGEFLVTISPGEEPSFVFDPIELNYYNAINISFCELHWQVIVEKMWLRTMSGLQSLT